MSVVVIIFTCSTFHVWITGSISLFLTILMIILCPFQFSCIQVINYWWCWWFQAVLYEKLLTQKLGHKFTLSAMFLFLLSYLSFSRRGNWITHKLKKLIKSSSRDQGLDPQPTPTHPGVPESQLPNHDNSSFISSDGSGGSAFTSAGDVISPHRHSSEYELLRFSRSSPIDLAEPIASKYKDPPPYGFGDKPGRNAGHKDLSGVGLSEVHCSTRGRKDTSEQLPTGHLSTQKAAVLGHKLPQNLIRLPPPPRHPARRRKRVNKPIWSKSALFRHTF